MLDQPTTTYDVAIALGTSVTNAGAYLSMLRKRRVVKVVGKTPGTKNNRPKNLWQL